MFNSLSKMPASRFKAGFGLIAALFGSSAAGAQPQTAPVSWPITSGLRIGDLAPQFQLPDSAGKPFDSRSLLGQKPLLLLIDGPTPLLKWNDDVLEIARKAAQRGAALALGAPNPQIGIDYSWPQPFTTFRVPDGSLKETAAPSFLVIDRAGWLRKIEKLPPTQLDPQSVRLQIQLGLAKDPTPELKVGQLAPDFSFRDADGNWRRVSALRGQKNLLLTFFPKCFTGKCRSQLTSLREEFPAFMAAETDVWAVSVDTAEGEQGQQAFAKELLLPFPMLPDTGRNICLLYGAASKTTDLAQRQSVLIDKNGMVRWITRNVNPDLHGLDVLAKITDLGMLPNPT